MKELNARIRQKRQEKGLTLLEVADYLGVKEATVQRYESGSIKNIKHETICKLAELFHCSPSWLMGFDLSSSGDLEATAAAIKSGKVAVPPIRRSDVPAETFIVDVPPPSEDDFIQNLSDEALELLRIFQSLSLKGKTKLLAFAYDLESKGEMM